MKPPLKFITETYRRIFNEESSEDVGKDRLQVISDDYERQLILAGYDQEARAFAVMRGRSIRLELEK